MSRLIAVSTEPGPSWVKRELIEEEMVKNDYKRCCICGKHVSALLMPELTPELRIGIDQRGEPLGLCRDCYYERRVLMHSIDREGVWVTHAFGYLMNLSYTYDPVPSAAIYPYWVYDHPMKRDGTGLWFTVLDGEGYAVWRMGAMPEIRISLERWTLDVASNRYGGSAGRPHQARTTIWTRPFEDLNQANALIRNVVARLEAVLVAGVL